MCKAWDDHKKRGREEGRAEGRAEEREEGLSVLVHTIKQLVASREKLCELVRANEVYKNYSDVQILKYY